MIKRIFVLLGLTTLLIVSFPFVAIGAICDKAIALTHKLSDLLFDSVD